MAETSRFWDGTSVGDATSAPYDAPTEFANVLLSMLGKRANSGRIMVADGCLIATGVSSPISVAAGKAINYGTWYENDAAISVAIPTPAGSTRIDRVVLRKSWAAQTIRLTRIAGTEGTGLPPVLVQTAGTTWDIPVAQVSITTGAVITCINEQETVSLPVERIKQSTTTIISDSSVNDDPELFYYLAANERVRFKLFVMYTSDATADFKATITIPAAATIKAASVKMNATGVLEYTEITASGGTFGANWDGNYTVAIIEGVVTNGANAGKLQFQWSQISSTAINTSVLVGSTLTVIPTL